MRGRFGGKLARKDDLRLHRGRFSEDSVPDTDKQSASLPIRRLIRAFAIVAILLFVVPGIDFVGRFATSEDNSTTYTDIDWEVNDIVLTGLSNPFSSLDRIEQSLDTEPNLPQMFADEIGFLAGARDIRANSNLSIVGYLVDGDADSVSDRLDTHMASEGWSSIPLGEVRGATYMKATGNCRWALATCTQIGTATSVVIRCAAQ